MATLKIPKNVCEDIYKDLASTTMYRIGIIEEMRRIFTEQDYHIQLNKRLLILKENNPKLLQAIREHKDMPEIVEELERFLDIIKGE